MTTRRLALILGDQLSFDLPSLQALDPQQDAVLLAEVAAETDYVPHHPQKIALIFSAMRHFAEALRERGWRVHYVRLDDAQNSGSLPAELQRWAAQLQAAEVHITECGEWRLEDELKRSGVPIVWHADNRFICGRDEFARWAEGRKQLRMEFFYREMRRKTGLLINGDGTPVGGAWNFDAENRKALPKQIKAPMTARFPADAITQEVLTLVAERFSHHYGSLASFDYPVSHAEAEALWQHFLDFALPAFGDYQDAMALGEPFLFHARISAALNIGLLDVRRLCADVEAAYWRGQVPLNAAEGFIRQLIGWREYVRGIYWLHMPEYAERNAFGNTRPLPEFYWTGKTRMKCMSQAIDQTLEHAYAHHIQRLMVTGNFALLAGIDPAEVHDWYLSVYIDAYEWVEAPNTIGMSQFADGGIVGSKPYVSSGNYINKMSDYCKHCTYSVSAKTGKNACPFNLLYWDFLVRHRKRFERNPRISRVYGTWDRMDADKRNTIAREAADFLQRMKDGDVV